MRLLLVLALLLVLGAIVLFGFAPEIVEAQRNVVQRGPSIDLHPATRALHEQLFIADLHNDLLLWNRDPLVRGDRGHTDLPRLLEGNVGLQVLSAVTKVPSGINYERNEADSDAITALAVVQRWPAASWTSLLERALYQADRLRDAAARSEGRMVLIGSQRDLEAYLQRRRSGEQLLGTLLSVEGLHALEGRLDGVDSLYASGYRMLGLTHFFDNEVAGSAHGVQQGGLTPLGREVIGRMEELGMILDLAHASPTAFDEAITLSTQPVVVSHTGVQGTCPGPRNLSDEQLRAVAATGGVVGIGFWEGATCEVSVRAIARAMHYAADLIGSEHVALGSDFDGSTTVPFDASELAQLTQALMDEGFEEADVRQVMGANVLRILQEILPEETTSL